MAFAVVSDIEARWRTLDSDEAERAQTLLEDASAMLKSQIPDLDVADSAYFDLLRIVCCNMVIRAMSATEADSFGASNMSMTAGPYTQSWTYSNPTGDMYITKFEKRLLGISSGYIDSIRPKIGRGCHD